MSRARWCDETRRNNRLKEFGPLWQNPQESPDISQPSLETRP